MRYCHTLSWPMKIKASSLSENDPGLTSHLLQGIIQERGFIALEITIITDTN